MVDLQLHERPGAVAVDVPFPAEAQVAAEPAVGQLHTDRVGAVPQQGGDVVGLVPQPVVVAGPARRQHLIADHGPVQLGLIDAVGSGVQPGPDDRAVDDELPAQQRRAGSPPGPGFGSTGWISSADQSAGSSSPASTTTSSLQADGSAAPSPHTRTRTDRRSRLASSVAAQGTSTDSAESTRPDEKTGPSSGSISSSYAACRQLLRSVRITQDSRGRTSPMPNGSR